MNQNIREREEYGSREKLVFYYLYTAKLFLSLICLMTNSMCVYIVHSIDENLYTYILHVRM